MGMKRRGQVSLGIGTTPQTGNQGIVMRFLITGGAGYIGVPLIELLLSKGHQVRCLDRLYFGEESLQMLLRNQDLEVIRDDIRWFDPIILKGIEIVIDLASLSNDPSGELDPAKTYDINYLGRVRVAKLSKEYGVRRYILASTCSVYGFQETVITEESNVNPLTTYAKCAAMAEKDVIPLANSDFTVVIPRFATVYGYAPRMRFDLAINGMVLKLYQTGKISVMRDGTQWRPFIHVRDVEKAYLLLAEAEVERVNGKLFNVGSEEQNYQLFPLAKLIGESSGKPYEIEWYGEQDKRSYRVGFDRIRKDLGFKPDFTPQQGVKEIYEALEKGLVRDMAKTKTVEWYKHLLDSERLLKRIMLRDTVL